MVSVEALALGAQLEGGGGAHGEGRQGYGVGAARPAEGGEDGGGGGMGRRQRLVAEGKAGGREPGRGEEQGEGVEAVQGVDGTGRGVQVGGGGQAQAIAEGGAVQPGGVPGGEWGVSGEGQGAAMRLTREAYTGGHATAAAHTQYRRPHHGLP